MELIYMDMEQSLLENYIKVNLKIDKKMALGHFLMNMDIMKVNLRKEILKDMALYIIMKIMKIQKLNKKVNLKIMNQMDME